MQTFLPYPSFAESLASLDYKRLGKQRVEAKQLVNAIAKGNGGWVSHPSAIMWRQYIPALMLYHDMAIDEWVRRGYNNTMQKYTPDNYCRIWVNPWWLGDEKFHASHRSNLLRKDSVHYGKFGWTESNDLPYVWPAEFKPGA